MAKTEKGHGKAVIVVIQSIEYKQQIFSQLGNCSDPIYRIQATNFLKTHRHTET